MTVGVIDSDPLVSRRALLEIGEEVQLQDSQYDADDGSPQMQFRMTLRALKGCGDRDGETFVQYFTFPANGRISSATKTGQMLAAALRGEAQAERLEELAEALAGKRFVAAIGPSRNGRYSNVLHDTISPAPAPERKSEPEPPKDEDEDFSDLPF